MTTTIESRGLTLHIPEHRWFAMRNETWDGEDRGNEPHFLTCGWTPEGELDPQWIPVRRILAGEGGSIFLQGLIYCAVFALMNEPYLSDTGHKAQTWAALSRLIEAEKEGKTCRL